MQYGQRPEDAAKNIERREKGSATPLQWLLRGGHDVTIRSLGEYFLPYFLAAMEACWLNGIFIGLAGLDFLHSGSALLPFWGPPLLLIAAIWLFRRALQKESAAQTGSASAEDADSRQSLAMPGLSTLVVVLGLLTIFLIWLHVYAHYFLLDPSWLLAFLNDLIALNATFYQAVMIIAFTIYVCWRGMKLAQLDIEPGHVFRQLWVGLLVLMAAILLRARMASAGGNFDDIVLVLLVPVFLYLALSTHALARIIFIRREHPFGLEGSVTAQERATLSMITGTGLVLLVITILGGSLFSPAFFSSLHPVWSAFGAVYDLLVRAFSQLAAWIITPFFWLASWWFSRFPDRFPTLRPPTTDAKNPKHLLQIDPTAPGIVFATRIILPILIFLVLLLLVRLALRRRKRLRVALNIKGGDLHESLWSWQLFWGQFRAFWRALFQRFFPTRAGEDEQANQADELASAVPAARTIREIYRALLKKAARRGHVRKRDETPYEFRQRLNAHEPENEPQLGLLTEAYALTRYGGTVPNERELATIRGFWNELDQKWETSS